MKSAAPARRNAGFWDRVTSVLKPGGAAKNSAGPRRLGRRGAGGDGHAQITPLSTRTARAQQIDEAFEAGWSQCELRRVSMAVVVIEVDRFREYGRAYGPVAAENCLLAVQTAIRAALPRSEDFLGRQGRAAFTVLLPDYPMLMAQAAAQKIAAAIAEAGIAHKESHRGQVTVSVGVAMANPRGETNRNVLTVAQAALERARGRGLNRIEIIDMRPHQKAMRRGAA